MLNVRVRMKKDTESNWSSKNPVLLDGEMAVSTDKGNRYKVGDGSSTWSALSYNSMEEVTKNTEDITEIFDILGSLITPDEIDEICVI